jgi:glycosyltransferase involved in cell wall biosynthesis
VSINSKRDIQNIYKISENKISVIGEGVDNRFKTISNKQLLDRVRKKYHLPKRFILFVGTIEPRKNLPLLLSAFAKIKDKFGIKLIVVGKLGWKYENIFNTASQLKIKNDFIFTGFVEDNDLPAIYNLAKVFVYPSYYEGFGLPVLEAMACGCPVITSSTSSLSEIVGNAAILINPTNIKDITEVILKIVSNKKLKLELIKQGLKQVKKFNWQNCAKKTLNVYQSLNYA